MGIGGKKFVILVTSFLLIGTAYWYITEPYNGEVVYQQGTTLEGAKGRGGPGDLNPDKDEVTCLFPDFDAFNPNAMKYYQKYQTTRCPDGMPTITHYNGVVIKVNQTKKQKAFGMQEIRCWYRSCTYQRRVDYVVGEWIGPFVDFIKVSGQPEYVEVTCSNKNDREVSRMHHYIVREEERKSLKPPKHTTIFKGEQMNVLLLGLDSLASHLLKRAMPKTRDYLLNNMKAIEMTKYNKVGDNTFPNLLAIGAGVFQKELKNWTQMEGFDKVPFLWKRFKSAGYRTQYMSDRPDFDDFVAQPTDSYNIPMLRALMKNKIAFDNNCFEDQIEVKLWLDLIHEFARESLYTTGRFFSFAMIKRPTHDFPNQASAVDQHYFNFLKTIHESGLLNNTFLAFFGDHGPRMSDYRRTLYGSIEERAAAMVIYTPPWFRNKFPTQYKNLQTNSRKLTTNFDVYATVEHLLYLPDRPAKSSPQILNSKGENRAISLFSTISPKRTCDDATLTPHMCLCNGGVDVSNPQIRQDVGLQVVKDINKLLNPKANLCAPLKLKYVTSLVLLNGRPLRTALYRIMFATDPGEAMFEATVQYTVTLYFFTKIESLGLISRINMYRGQSDCVDDDKVIRMYCYCKNVLDKKRLV